MQPSQVLPATQFTNGFFEFELFNYETSHTISGNAKSAPASLNQFEIFTKCRQLTDQWSKWSGWSSISINFNSAEPLQTVQPTNCIQPREHLHGMGTWLLI